LLWFEGHPAVDGLAPPASLAAAADRVHNGLLDLGLPLGRDGGIRRLDQTVTLRFSDRHDGLALLRGLAVLDIKRHKKAVYESAIGQPETVYLLGPGRSRRVLARCYDKGVESGTASPGELIRFENQSRFNRDVGELLTPSRVSESASFAGSAFAARFAPVAECAEGVTAAIAPVLADRVAELVADGDLSPAKGARLYGYLMMGDKLELPERTRRSWRSELRDLGLVLVDPMEDPLEVDLGEALDAALGAWSA